MNHEVLPRSWQRQRWGIDVYLSEERPVPLATYVMLTPRLLTIYVMPNHTTLGMDN